MKTKIGIAKILRNRETGSEALVWEKIRNRQFRGLKFRRQHIIKGFVVDFYCAEFKLAIEVDGGIHLKQVEYDALRQTVIKGEDIHVLRINSDEVGNLETILETWIARHLKSGPVDPGRIPPLHLLKNGEGGRG